MKKVTVNLLFIVAFMLALTFAKHLLDTDMFRHASTDLMDFYP